MSQFDIVFLSYNEPNAEDNFGLLLSNSPQAKRLHGVKGLGRAVKLTAELVDTEHYFLIDGDNELLPDFNFDLDIPICDNTHYIWACKNPVNGLVYGYGGIKLLTKSGVRKFSDMDVDLTTSGKVEFLDTVASVTKFNTSHFSSWKAGFREGCMLSLPDNTNPMAKENLKIWQTIGKNVTYGESAMIGAIDGEEFAKENLNSREELLHINNPSWLLQEYRKRRNF